MVDKTVGRTTNKTDTATVGAGIALNASTSTTALSLNKDRTYIALTVDGGDVWIKLQAASADNLKKGTRLCDGQTYELPPDNIYTGEISAIAVSGTPDIYPTEF